MVLTEDEYQKTVDYYKNELKNFVGEVETLEIYENSVFDRILSLLYFCCPDNLLSSAFTERCTLRSKITQLLNDELARRMVTDIERHPRKLVKNLNKFYINQLVDVRKMVEIIVTYKCFESYINYQDRDYEDAMKCSRWCLQFIYYAESKLLIKLYNDPNYFAQAKMFCAMFCAKCVMIRIDLEKKHRAIALIATTKLKEYALLDYLFHLILELFPEEKIEVQEITHKMFMSNLFEILGDIESKLSLFQGNVIDEHRKTVHCRENGVILNRDHLERVLKMYILAFSFRFETDPYKVTLINKIITGLLEYGGIYTGVVELFYRLNVHYCKINKVPLENYYNKLPRYGKMVYNLISRGRTSISQPAHSRLLELPRVMQVDMTGSLKAVDDFYPECCQKHNNGFLQFFCSIKNKIKIGTDSSILREKEATQSWDFGIFILNFLERCCNENMGGIPDGVSEILEHQSIQ